MNAMVDHRMPVSEPPLPSSESPPEPRKVRVLIRKRHASIRQASTSESSSGEDRIDNQQQQQISPSKLVDYKHRAIKTRLEEQRQRRRQGSKRPKPKKQIRFDETRNVQHAASHSLTDQVIQDSFYTKADIDKMVRFHHRLASRSMTSSSNIRSHDDLRGLEDYMGANALATSNQRKLQYTHAVLNEQERQRQDGYYCAEDIRKQARLASKTSRAIALQLGQKDAQQTTKSNSRPSHQAARVRSKSICGPSGPLAATAASSGDARSRRSNSMRVNLRTAAVVM